MVSILLVLLTISTLHIILGKDVENHFIEKPISLEELKVVVDDQLNQLRADFKDQVDLLHSENNVQKRLLQRTTREINQLKRQVDRLMANLQSPKKRLTRSTDLNRVSRTIDSRASSASNLEISPTALGSMPYRKYRIGIYGHFNNDRKKTVREKKFYYMPIFLLNHESATSNVTMKQPQVRFSIEMWTDDLEEKIRNYTSTLVRHPVNIEQVQVLPIEELKLVDTSPHNLNPKLADYQLVNIWYKYQQQHQSLRFTFTCLTEALCNQLANEMKSNPHYFDGRFLLVVRLRSLISNRKEVVIRIENIVKGDLISKLIQRYPSYPEKVYLTAKDKQTLISESYSSIMLDMIADSPEMKASLISPDSEKRIRDFLTNLFKFSEVAIKKESEKMWQSVFWNDDNYRPDEAAKIFNDIYNKLGDDQQRNQFKSSIDKTKVGLGGYHLKSGGDLYVEKENGETYSEKELKKIIDESREKVEWTGKEFAPKQMNLTRINLANLKNSKDFREKAIHITYTTTILLYNVNTQDNLGKQFKDEIFALKNNIRDLTKYLEKNQNQDQNERNKFKGEIIQIKNKLKDVTEGLKRPQCYQHGKAPESCQELHCIGYKLNGFYFVKGQKRVEVVYCNFDAIENSFVGAGLQAQIGYANIKSVAGGVFFYVQRNSSFSEPNAIIPFHIQRLNVGGAMNLSAGVFTAPCSGIYHFSFNGIKDSSGVTLIIQLKLNEGSPNETLIGTACGDRNGFFTYALKGTLKLKTGDRISLKKIGKGVLRDNDNHFTHFTGRLLEEELFLP